MLDSKNTHYIFKLSGGKTMDLYHKEDKGLALSVLNKSNTWLSPYFLEADSVPGFSACLDEKDWIHILYQDKKGALKHMVYRDKDWEVETVLQSKKALVTDKQPFITEAGGVIYFFYVLEHAGSKFLSYQSLGNGINRVTVPKAVDYIDGDDNLYTVIPRGENFYIFYRYAYGSRNQVGYRVMNSKTGKMSEFFTVSGYNMEDSNQFRTALLDKDGTFHLIWERNGSDSYSLIYSRKEADAGEWSGESVLGTYGLPYFSCGILAGEDKLTVYCSRDTGLLSCSSDNGGAGWSQMTNKDYEKSKNLFRIRYCSDENARKVVELPGTLDKGFQPFFEIVPECGDDIQPADTQNAACVNPGLMASIAIERLRQMKTKLDALEEKQRKLEIMLDELKDKYS